MAEGEERVEVELTGDRSMLGSHGPADRLEAVGGEDDRSRVVLIALVAAVLGVVVGWTLGRAADTTDERSIGASAAPTTGARRANPIAPIDTVESEPSAPSSSSVIPSTMARPTTVPRSSEPDVDTSSASHDVRIAAPIAGLPIEIVAVGSGRTLVRLDVATGRLRSEPSRTQPFGQVRILLGDDWILFPSRDPNLPSTVIGSSGDSYGVDLGAGRNLIGGADRGLWRISADNPDAEGVTLEPITINGEPTGPPIELPGLPRSFDPRGGFVVEAAGGVYSVSDAGIGRITPGELLALGVDTALADECDELLDCGLVVIDRATGDRRPVGLRQPVGPTDRRFFGSLVGESISSDGGAAIVRVINPSSSASSQPTLGMIDLVSSEVTEIGPAQNIDEAVWTPDGRFVLYNSGGRIVAFDRAAGTEVVVTEELIAIDTFAIRTLR